MEVEKYIVLKLYFLYIGIGYCLLLQATKNVQAWIYLNLTDYLLKTLTIEGRHQLLNPRHPLTTECPSPCFKVVTAPQHPLLHKLE